MLYYKGTAEVRNIAIDFGAKLGPDELLTGTPVVVEVGSTDLTISHPLVINDIRSIGTRLAKANEAVEVIVAGGVAGTTYRLRATATTDATNPQTLVQEVELRTI